MWRKREGMSKLRWWQRWHFYDDDDDDDDDDGQAGWWQRWYFYDDGSCPLSNEHFPSNVSLIHCMHVQCPFAQCPFTLAHSSLNQLHDLPFSTFSARFFKVSTRSHSTSRPSPLISWACPLIDFTLPQLVPIELYASQFNFNFMPSNCQHSTLCLVISNSSLQGGFPDQGDGLPRGRHCGIRRMYWGD